MQPCCTNDSCQNEAHLFIPFQVMIEQTANTTVPRFYWVTRYVGVHETETDLIEHTCSLEGLNCWINYTIIQWCRQLKMTKIARQNRYRNCCIDFDQILHNDGDHHVVVVGGPNRRSTNPRWRTAPFWKKRKIAISLQPFDRVWWDLVQWRIFYPYSGSTVKISNFWKSKMAAAAILKNHKNRDISATVWSIFTKFSTLMQTWSINRYDCYKIWISKIQDGGRPPFWKP